MDGHLAPKLSALVREFVLIFAGVTLALGIDSVRAVRQDRAREAEYLEQLAVDLVENRARLAEAIRDEKTLGAAAVTAMEALKSGVVISPDSARRVPLHSRPERRPRHRHRGELDGTP